MSEATYNVSEAAKKTGLSYTSISNAKEKLAAAGATVEGKGSTWVIPESALSVLNKPRKKAVSSSADAGSLDALRSEYAAAQNRADELKAEASEAAAHAKSLKKELDATARKVLRTAEAALEKAQAELALAKELTESE